MRFFIIAIIFFWLSPGIAQTTSGDNASSVLHHLCKSIGPRLSGSVNAQKAVEFGYAKMKEYRFDTVFLQPVMVPHWERGKTEKVVAGDRKLHVKALGGSVGTDGEIVSAQVLEVKSFTELENLGELVKGKIIFFNRPMDPKFKDTFQAYSGAVDQRGDGAVKAARLGAVAVLVRSMTLKLDQFAHTGALRYVDSIPKVPAVAVCTEDAQWLSQQIAKEKTFVSIELSCKHFPEALSYNVVGEIKGTQFPNKFISVGGHLDSWDVGEGAHDDGAGVAQSLEALRLLKASGIKPRHSIRCVWFMNEENGNRGGMKYAFLADSLKEVHVAAIESDRGGFMPEAFSVDGTDSIVAAWQKFVPELKGTGITEIFPGYGGVDIGPLKKVYKDIPLIGLVPNSTHYFDYHHADTDVFESVNPVELQKGAEAMFELIKLLDKELN